jgi:hypothetical protein
VGGPKQWAVTLTQIWLSDRMIPNWSSMPSMRQNGATASADAPAHPVRAPLISLTSGKISVHRSTPPEKRTVFNITCHESPCAASFVAELTGDHVSTTNDRGSAGANGVERTAKSP